MPPRLERAELASERSLRSVGAEKRRPQSLEKRDGLQFEEWDVALPKFTPLTGAMAGGPEAVEAIKNTYTNPRADAFEVRDVGYLQGAKVAKGGRKRASPDSAYSVVGVQVFKSRKSLEHVASKVASLKEFIARSAPKGAAAAGGAPEFLVVTWMFRSMWHKEYTSVVHLFRRNMEISVDAPKTGFERAFKAFLEGDDKVKSSKLKFAFKVREAPSALRKTVKLVGGERPVLIGKALTTQFFSGPNYLEVDQDVGSSIVASSLNSTILKAAAKICIDTAWLIEAQEEAELPERLLGVVRWHYVDPKAAYIQLDEEYNVVEQPAA